MTHKILLKRDTAKQPTSAVKPGHLAAIHIAQKSLGLTKDDAEALKLAVTGKASAADMSLEQRRKYLAHLSNLQAQRGLVVAKRPPSTVYLSRRPVDRAVDDPADARYDKCRAMWHALALAGHVRVDSAYALDRYIERQTKASCWRFLNTHQINQVIEALKRWCVRVGVDVGVPAA